MLFSTSAVAGFAIALFASSTAAANANSTIDPNTVLLGTRVTWCVSQRNVCGALCAGDTQDNDCFESTLTYKCNCASNSSTPGLDYYLGTIPTFVCNQIFQVCNTNNAGVASALAKCLQDQKANCGTLDSTKGDFSSSSSATPTPTGGPSPSGGAGAATTGPAAPGSTSSKAAAPTMMAVLGNYGSGVLVAGAAAAFGMML